MVASIGCGDSPAESGVIPAFDGLGTTLNEATSRRLAAQTSLQIELADFRPPPPLPPLPLLLQSRNRSGRESTPGTMARKEIHRRLFPKPGKRRGRVRGQNKPFAGGPE